MKTELTPCPICGEYNGHKWNCTLDQKVVFTAYDRWLARTTLQARAEIEGRR